MSMNMIPTEVIKFGGTLMGNAETILDSARFVRDASQISRVVVVVSATRGTTNVLSDISDNISTHNHDEAQQCIREFFDRHVQIVEDLELSSGQQAYLAEILYGAVEQLNLYAKSYVLKPPMRDYILSLGEYISSYIFTEALQKVGLRESEQVDAYKIIKTDSSFGEAKPDLLKSVENIQSIILPKLIEGRTVVTPGFYGIDGNGFTTTMGRNTSDMTGAIIAYGLHADRLILCKGVSGIFDNDPIIHGDARLCEELTYDEAAEIARSGGRVIHHEIMSLLEERDIPALVMDPRTPEMGTRIGRSKEVA